VRPKELKRLLDNDNCRTILTKWLKDVDTDDLFPKSINLSKYLDSLVKVLNLAEWTEQAVVESRIDKVKTLFYSAESTGFILLYVVVSIDTATVIQKMVPGEGFYH
jgi:hypothetical protein